MKRIPVVIYTILILAIAWLTYTNWQLHREKHNTPLPGTNQQNYRIVSAEIPDLLYFAGEKVPLELFYVRESLDRELIVNTYWHSSTLLLLKRAHRWFPLIDSILEAENIPNDFRYLAMIESGLDQAVSPAGAVGFWQFLKGTATEYGLEVSKEVDERYHVTKSTAAACQYLTDSYGIFQNWALVAAAYNAGKNGIKRFQESQKTTSYFDLLLADETSRYVYRILAMKMICENPQDYGFYLDEEELYPEIPTYRVTVDEKIDNWADFAAEYGISYKMLKYFNPWLRQTYLKNKKKKAYHITLPKAPYDLSHERLMKLEREQMAQ